MRMLREKVREEGKWEMAGGVLYRCGGVYGSILGGGSERNSEKGVKREEETAE
jgi:hypothetical protein